MIHAIRERHGIRMFWGNLRCEFYWWSSSFGVAAGSDDEGLHASAALPPFALYVSGGGYSSKRREGEFSLRFHDWTIWLTPWGRKFEWRAADPWWVRGVNLNLVDLVLGAAKCETTTLATENCVIPMPEGSYPAKATHERRVWRRSRWFNRVRESVWLDIPGGIPFAGKGENSWDCGDDGLFGIGGETLAAAIQRAQESVAESRRRHGSASDAAMLEAAERVVQ